MPDVKVLVAGPTNTKIAEKGDVVEVVPSTSDWGNKTVTPNWVRLVITGVPGATQQAAEDNVRGYLQAWQNAFTYSEVDGAAGGQQRYRVEASPEIANDFDLSTKIEIRDRILARFEGSLVNQSATHFEFDSYPYLELAEIAFEINQVAYRRFRFPDSLVDQAIASVNPGEPVEFSRTIVWVQSNVIDKLRT